MSKAVNISTTGLPASNVARFTNPPRRAMLTGGAAAALAAGIVGATGAAPASADAELIDLCADFDALERRIDALFDSNLSGLSFEGADAAAGVIEVDLHRLLDRICVTVPTTDAGCLAVARSLALLSPDYADALSSQPTMDERLASVLLRGMIGRADA